MKVTLWPSLALTAGLFVGCQQKPAEPETPTPIPYSSDMNAPTPYPAAVVQPYQEAKKKTPPAKKQGYVAPSRPQMRTALNGYGEWYTTPEYGDVWQPRGVQAGWRPYQQGHWVNSDNGWLWQASEPWGWLPYHYGHWVSYPRYGWVWVPGDTWVPAQVAWRANDQYVAWAPLPPGPRVNIDVIPASAWVVVPAQRFLEPRVYTYIMPPARVEPTLVVRLPPVSITGSIGGVTYYVGPQPTQVTRWVRTVPPPVRVETWRYEVPTRYAVHYDRGYREGWYRPTWAPPPPPPPRGVQVQYERRPVGMPPGQRGVEIDHRGPAGSTSVEIEHRGGVVYPPQRTVEVEHQGRGGHTEVEVERRGAVVVPPQRSVEVEHQGRGGHTEVEVERRGAVVVPPQRSVEVEHHGRGGNTEVEVERRGAAAPPQHSVEVEHHGRGGKTEVEVERNGRGNRTVEVEHQGKGHHKTEVEVERNGSAPPPPPKPRGY